MDVYQVISDPRRRVLLEALAAGPKPARELVALLPVSQPATAKHLRVLLDSGLVEATRGEHDARLRVYRLRSEQLRPVLGWLQQFWQSQLDGFAEHVREREA